MTSSHHCKFHTTGKGRGRRGGNRRKKLCRDRNGSKRKSEVGVGEIATRENEKNEGKRAKQSKEGKGREGKQR